MILYDVTLTISDTLITWPSDPPVTINKVSMISKGDACNVSELKLGSHCGTHVDAPSHFEENGLTIDKIPLDCFMGKATVFEIKNRKEIGLQDIKSLGIKNTERVIFKTINSTYWKLPAFKKDFVYLTKEAAHYLADCKVKLVGVDYLSIEKYKNASADVHHILLSKGMVIIEGLDMGNVEAGDYELIALPLKIKDGDGSPARVVLRR